jgi:hypothetical protein
MANSRAWSKRWRKAAMNYVDASSHNGRIPGLRCASRAARRVLSQLGDIEEIAYEACSGDCACDHHDRVLGPNADLTLTCHQRGTAPDTAA